MFTLSFDPQSMSEIAQFHGFGTFLSDEMKGAMQSAGQLLVRTIRDNTEIVFEHPTGELAGTVQAILDSPYELQVGSTSPYAARREHGFSGHTDSLGRTFHNDPGKPYFAPALESQTQAILTLVDDAVMAATGQLSGGGYASS